MKHLIVILVAAAITNTARADVQTETVSIPMRDGVALATDIYRDTAVSKAPVILMRTPYDKSKQKGMRRSMPRLAMSL